MQAPNDAHCIHGRADNSFRGACAGAVQYGWHPQQDKEKAEQVDRPEQHVLGASPFWNSAATKIVLTPFCV
jgi:hypothetical protein